MIKNIWCSVLFVALFSWGNSLYGQEQTSAANLRDGDVWHFQIKSKSARGADTTGGIIPTGTYVLRSAGRTLQAYQLVGNEEQLLDSSLGLFQLIGRAPGRAWQNTRLTATSRELDFPLFVGKTWQYNYELTGTRGTRHRNVTFQVLALERIESAVGAFGAFKIEKNIQWATAGPRWGTSVENVHAIYFYSPQTKSIVKYRSEGTDGATREVELVKFVTTDKGE